MPNSIISPLVASTHRTSKLRLTNTNESAKKKEHLGRGCTHNPNNHTDANHAKISLFHAVLGPKRLLNQNGYDLDLDNFGQNFQKCLVSDFLLVTNLNVADTLLRNALGYTPLDGRAGRARPTLILAHMFGDARLYHNTLRDESSVRPLVVQQLGRNDQMECFSRHVVDNCQTMTPFGPL